MPKEQRYYDAKSVVEDVAVILFAMVMVLPILAVWTVDWLGGQIDGLIEWLNERMDKWLGTDETYVVPEEQNE